jgi:hypothetical protein
MGGALYEYCKPVFDSGVAKAFSSSPVDGNIKLKEINYSSLYTCVTTFLCEILPSTDKLCPNSLRNKIKQAHLKNSQVAPNLSDA